MSDQDPKSPAMMVSLYASPKELDAVKACRGKLFRIDTIAECRDDDHGEHLRLILVPVDTMVFKLETD
jgi:hypothetical protein